MDSAPSGIRVRRARAEDAGLLAELAERTFVETFGSDNGPEDMAMHLRQTYGPEIQARELADPALSYFIAEVEGKPAGYALVASRNVPACVTGAAPVEVNRLYVEKPWHGAGVAKALMTECEAEARRRGGRTLWLGVWERNPRAIRFYEKCGFRDVGDHSFMLGTDRQTDRVLARDLDPEPHGGGTAI